MASLTAVAYPSGLAQEGATLGLWPANLASGIPRAVLVGRAGAAALRPRRRSRFWPPAGARSARQSEEPWPPSGANVSAYQADYPSHGYDAGGACSVEWERCGGGRDGCCAGLACVTVPGTGLDQALSDIQHCR